MILTPAPLINGCVEAAFIDRQGGLFCLTHLLDNLLVTGAQLVVAAGLLLDDGTDPVVLARVRRDVAQGCSAW
jgi:hypothetical protein